MAHLLFQLTEVQKPEVLDGPFYVIECFPVLQFVTDEDGTVKAFSAYHKALEEASDCQDGYVLVI